MRLICRGSPREAWNNAFAAGGSKQRHFAARQISVGPRLYTHLGHEAADIVGIFSQHDDLTR